MGPFDNESRKFLQVEGFESGHWYVNTDGQLYIVPDAEAEIEGPDDETLETLNEIYRSRPFREIDPNTVAETLGLEVVLDHFKRFDDSIGYFSS